MSNLPHSRQCAHVPSHGGTLETRYKIRGNEQEYPLAGPALPALLEQHIDLVSLGCFRTLFLGQAGGALPQIIEPRAVGCLNLVPGSGGSWLCNPLSGSRCLRTNQPAC